MEVMDDYLWLPVIKPVVLQTHPSNKVLCLCRLHNNIILLPSFLSKDKTITIHAFTVDCFVCHLDVSCKI